LTDPALELALHLSQLQVLDQIQRGAKEHLVAGLDRLVADPDGQVGLAHAGRADEDQVVAVVDKAKVEQRVDLSLGDRGLVAVVKALQALLGREGGLAPVQRYSLVRALLQLVLGQQLSKAQVGELVGLRLGEQVGQLSGGGGQPQAAVLGGGLLKQVHGSAPGHWSGQRRRTGAGSTPAPAPEQDRRRHRGPAPGRAGAPPGSAARWWW